MAASLTTMIHRARIHLSGKARVSVLVMLAASLALGIFAFVRRAEAQNAASATAATYTYQPVWLVPLTGPYGNEFYQVDVVTPDDSTATTPFRLEFVTPSGTVSDDLVASGRAFWSYYMYIDTSNPTHPFLDVINGLTYTLQTIKLPKNATSVEVMVRVMPETTAAGKAVAATSTGGTLYGSYATNGVAAAYQNPLYPIDTR